MAFGPLSPLTGEDSEWNEIGEGRFQNRRSSRVFKDEDGRAYDIEGRVFRDGAGCYTSRDSRVYVEFPYPGHRVRGRRRRNRMTEARGPGSAPIPNDAAFDASGDVLTATAQGRLRSIIERLERLEEDKQAVMVDMKEVFAEAKGEGYDVAVLRKLLSLRKKDKAKLQEQNAILQLYAAAVGCEDLI